MRPSLLIAAGLLAGLGCSRPDARVGTKKDPESQLLGAMAGQLVESTGATAEVRKGLGGTPVVWEALTSGQIDVYPEYTGTLAVAIFHDPTLADHEKLRAKLESLGIGMTRPLGFENNYALAVRAETAEELGLRTISDLAAHPDLTCGFSTEFISRQDCWPGLRQHYDLPQTDPQPLAHGIAYQSLVNGDTDVTDVYTTDAEIARFNLVVLADDLNFFPKYDALYVYRLDWAAAHPVALASLDRLEGRLDDAVMRRMNGDSQVGTPVARTSATFLRATLGVSSVVRVRSPARRIADHTVEHLFLVGLSLTAAIVAAVPLGVVAARRPRLGRAVIGFAGLVQTIPALALLVFLVMLGGGLGWRPAVVALFLYSLLPIVRNTATGLVDIPITLREAADGLGLSPWRRLRLVELPLASRSILAGVKTAAVINIGTATLGAFVGAGGLGVPIQEGLAIYNPGLILQGAIPAAALALLAEAGFGLVERLLVPRGLRLVPGE